ncbi:uncharacterized protein E1O_07550 [Burkholderiales bacterium GJ-E10]|nr:uncharacterized protein E1O_07550 [Burkholderiales bacterium GJ-E10]
MSTSPQQTPPETPAAADPDGRGTRADAPSTARPSGGAGGMRDTAAAALAGFALGAMLLGVALAWQNHRWQQQLARQAVERAGQIRREDALERRIAGLERQAAVRPVAPQAAADVALDPQLRSQLTALVLFDAERVAELVQVQLRLGLAPARAIGVLSVVDARLGKLPTPAAARVRRALADDLARLRTASTADVGAAAARLDSVLRSVGAWRTLADTAHGALDLPAPHPAPAATGKSAAGQNGGREGRIRAWLEDAFGGLLRIQPVPTPDAVRLDPAQQEILRDRVRLELLDLQQAVLLRDGVRARIREQSLESLLQRYFDPRDPAIAAALTQIRTAADAASSAAPPALDETLAALRAAVRTGGN